MLNGNESVKLRVERSGAQRHRISKFRSFYVAPIPPLARKGEGHKPMLCAAGHHLLQGWVDLQGE